MITRHIVKHIDKTKPRARRPRRKSTGGAALPEGQPQLQRGTEELQETYNVFYPNQTCSNCICVKPWCTVCFRPNDYSDEGWVVQSAEHDLQAQETVSFHNTTSDNMGGVKVSMDQDSITDATNIPSVVKFLSRPVKIASFTWNESDAVKTSHTYNPWNLYFTDTRVQYKLNNFAFIQCKLKVKILINASPFYYGAMYCGYQPLPLYTPSTITADSGNKDLILFSQRPHIWLDPQNNTGGEMELPFFFNRNYLDAQSASAFTNMGQLTFLNYTTLQSANGATGAGVSVVLYAWAEDVVLSGNSVGLATQAWEVQSDEYGVGPVSSIASAVARVAHSLRTAPIIGKFATATEIGASAVGSIAKLFGFTNVPVISNVEPYRPQAFPQLASTEVGFPIEKLTLDPKNELALSGASIGLTDIDELSIAHLSGKESYLTTTTWSTSDAVDKILFSSLVTPEMYNFTANTYQTNYYPTPMCWISQLFAHWRGDLIFRFKVVASMYHKGRLRISFDPSGQTGENILSDANSANVVYTEIVDLSEKTDVEFRIPYQQAYAFLYTQAMTSTLSVPWSTSASPTFSYDSKYHNGTICLRVQTALTAPIASSSVNVLMFVRAAENIEFANPNESLSGMTLWDVQADVEEMGSTVVEQNTVGLKQEIPAEIIGTRVPIQNDTHYRVYFGEQICSLRKLLRRISLAGTEYVAADNVSYWAYFVKTFSRLPLNYGFDPHGIQQCTSISSTGTKTFNFTTMHPITYVISAFVGYKGSVNWVFDPDFNVPLKNVRVSRLGYSTPAVAAATNKLYFEGPGTSANKIANTALTSQTTGAAGTSLNTQLTNAGINVQLPNYTAFKFQSTDVTRTSAPISGDGSDRDFAYLSFVINTVSQPLTGGHITSFAGIGTDFNCFFFLNVPTLKTYTGAITPP